MSVATVSVVLLLALFANVAAGGSFSKVSVDDPSAVCNDGSPYVFYLQAGTASGKWIIYFQGGLWCYDLESCNARMKASPSLMSSKSYTAQAYFGGVLDDASERNPLFSDWNKVFLPYCTSDDFSGARNASDGHPWAFQGSRVVPAVVVTLQRAQNLAKASVVVMAGSSAGGEGLYPNVDLVSEKLLPQAKVFALDDSGYFMYSTPFQGSPVCTPLAGCTEQDGISRGVPYWNAQLNERCVAAKSWDRRFECLMGPTVLPFIRTRVFVFQYLFDAAQLGHDGIGDPTGNSKQMQYAVQSANNLTQSLIGAKFVFLPACYFHTILMDPAWTTMQVQGVLLTEAIAAFLNGKDGLRLIDSCSGSVRCNPTCPKV